MDLRHMCYDYLVFLLLLIAHTGICEDYDDDFSSKSCPPIRHKLKNGRVKIRSRGRIAKFICDGGYELAGKRFATCVSGRWNNQLPVCIARGCPRQPPLHNGHVTEMYRGAMLIFDCNPGYALDGDISIHCDGRRWNTSAPSCEVATTDPELSCDFEDPHLCGWTQDPHHEFDWKRNQFTTPSGHVGTGPSYDHTYGMGKGGFYLYLEASSPRKLNDTTRIFSPVYPHEYSGSCFVFWYHMYGAATGGLRLYLKQESYVIGELSPSWEKWGDQGNEWSRGHISIPSLPEDFQIIIEGVRGPSYVGDSAIDDVKLIQSSTCETLENTTDIVEHTIAESCRGRCREPDDEFSCGCNEDCVLNDNCCSDYKTICLSGNNTFVENPDEPLPDDEFGKTTSPVTITITKQTSLESTKSATRSTISSTKHISTSTAAAITPLNPSTTIADIIPLTTSSTPRSSSILSTPSTTTTQSTPSTVTTPRVITTALYTPSTVSIWLTTRQTKPSPVATTVVSETITSSTSAPTKLSTTSLVVPVTQTIPPTTFKPTTSVKTTSSTTAKSPTTSSFYATTKLPATTTFSTTIATTSTSIPSNATSVSSTEMSSQNTNLPIIVSTATSATTMTSTATSSSSVRSSITSTPSTRKTYNLRPRTQKTTLPSSRLWQSTSTLPNTSPGSTSPRATAITSAPNSPLPVTKDSLPKYSSQDSDITVRYSLTSRSYFITPTTLRTIPKITTTSNRATAAPRIITYRPASTPTPNKFTQTTLLVTMPTDSLRHTSKEASTSNKDTFPTVAIITLSVAFIICVSAGLVYYMKKQRANRQSKLPDDSEMRFLSENEESEYSDPSVLDRILIK